MERGYSITCVVCGKAFKAIMPNAKVCSHKCRLKYRRVRARRLANKKSLSNGNICPICGKKFGGRVRKYCSVECRKKAINAYSAQRSIEISRDLLPPPTRRCHDCGAPTDNYRCEACLAKWRAKHGVPPDGGEMEVRYAFGG